MRTVLPALCPLQVDILQARLCQALGRSLYIDEATAKFYLEDAGGDVKTAMEAFGEPDQRFLAGGCALAFACLKWLAPACPHPTVCARLLVLLPSVAARFDATTLLGVLSLSTVSGIVRFHCCPSSLPACCHLLHLSACLVTCYSPGRGMGGHHCRAHQDSASAEVD